jgi:hypothetical protein
MAKEFTRCMREPVRRRRVRLAGIFALVLLLFGLSVHGQGVFHVRSGATGNGSGSDWNNAYTSLPSTLQRGATYYVAAGNYPGYKFRDPNDGTKWITIKKATVAEHGSSVGWNNTYASGPAVWSPTLTFRGNYYIFDGVTGGGPSSWDSGHGFVIASGGDSTFILISDKWGSSADRVDVNDIVIKHVELRGKLPVEPCMGSGIDATALGAKVRNITVSHCYFRGLGRLQMRWADATDILVQYSYMAQNASSSTCHGFSARHDRTTRATYRWNRFENIVGTGWIGLYGGTLDSLEVYGNTFNHRDGFTGSYGNGVIYSTVSDAGNMVNAKVHHNAFVNLPSKFLIFVHSTGSNNFAYNNMFYRIGGGNPAFNLFTVDYSWFGEPSGTFGQPNAQGGSGDPFVDWRNRDFRLRQNTTRGITLPTPYDRDMFGNVAGTGGGWDRGAIQLAGESAGPASPSGLKVVAIE